MSQPIKPALTADEWEAGFTWSGAHMIEGNTELSFKVRLKADSGDLGRSVGEITADELHAIAALILYGRPFGFTRGDVVECRLAAQQFEASAKRYRGERDGGLTAEAHEKLAQRFRERASKIEALLPPEKP